MADKKPTLTLLRGSQADNLESLIALYTKLTGRSPSEADIAECAKILDDHKKKS